jgi:hypothetical protein
MHSNLNFWYVYSSAFSKRHRLFWPGALCIVTMFFPNSIFGKAILNKKHNGIAISTLLLCNLFTFLKLRFLKGSHFEKLDDI